MRDYHIHYYIDSCASEEMTFPNIESKCAELGIDEVAVLKHYSAAMPNGEDDWICWHRTRTEQWEQYLREYAAYTPRSVKMHSGVETELCNEAGDINIPLEEQQKINLVQLSVHYMIELECLPLSLLIYPNLSFCPEYNNDEGRRLLEEWKQKTADAGEENIIKGLVSGYMNAIKRYPKVKSLAHMGDGLVPLRTYLVNLEKVSLGRTIELFEPLMSLMADKGVVWELAGSCSNTAMLKRADELGVAFTATADAHFLDSGWGPLTKHYEAEQFIDSLSLRRGKIEF